jgi:hypothetical protein
VEKAEYKKNKEGKWVKIQAFHMIHAFSEIKLSQTEILNNISPNDLSKIKSDNAHPYFRAYSIAHEGISVPKIIGEGYKKIAWPRRAIQSLKNITVKGIKFFKGHNEDNTTDNREYFGEVIGNFEKEIDGKIHHIVIGYFPDKSSVVNDDIVSMEADWSFVKNAGKWIADKIDSITGIALGDSSVDTPAFSGAKMLGAVQALEGEKEKKIMEITFQDVQKFVQDHNVWPWQLFSIEQVKADREIGKYFIEFEAKQKKLSEDLQAITDKAKAAEDKLKLVEGEYNKTTAKTRLESHLKTNNITLTEKEKLFLDTQFKTLSDYSDDSLKKFVDTSKELYKDLAKSGLFGEKEKIIDVGTNPGTKKEDNLKDNEFIIAD